MSAQTLDLAPAPTLADVRSGKRKRSLKRLLLGSIVVLAAGAAGEYGYNWWTVGRFIMSTDDAYVGGEVTVIASRVSGLITEVAVADNQQVKTGDVLLRIDDRPFKAELARADANVAAQQATLENLAASRRLQQAVLAGAEADLDSARAETARTKFDYDRYRALSTDQFASQQRFQQADADWKKAQAGVAKAQAAIEAAQRQLDVIDTQRGQTEAALGVARADQDLARLNVGYTEVRAPIDGVIGNRSARAGAYATVGAALVSVVPARGLWVDANFKENQLAAMRPGQVVTIDADVVPGESFTGHVESLAPATGAQFSVLPPENATGNFTKIVQRVPVRIRLDDVAGTLGRLRPGLSVTASVDERTENGPGRLAAVEP